MPTTGNEIRAAVKQRLANIARSPDEEKKFPVGPASAKKLGCSKVQVDVHQTPHGRPHALMNSVSDCLKSPSHFPSRAKQ